MVPEQIKVLDPLRAALAPYNFLPLPPKIVLAEPVLPTMLSRAVIIVFPAVGAASA